MTDTLITPAADATDPAVVAAQAEVDAAETARLAAEAAAAAPVVPVVPETYTLKLPDGSTIDPAIVERTAADARELGLSNEAGQKLLDKRVQETITQQKAAEDAVAAVTASWEPKTGAKWIERNDALKAQALADPEIGGSPEKLAASAEKAEQALAKYGSPDLTALLNKEGLLSHPEAIRFLSKIGKAMSEPGTLVLGGGAAAPAKGLAEQMYGADGTGIKN